MGFEIRIQSIELQEFGKIYQGIYIMKVSFYNTGELNGSSFVKKSVESFCCVEY